MHKMFLYGSMFQINLQVRSFQYIVLNNTMYLSWQMMQEKLIAMMHIESFSSKDPGTHDKIYMLITVYPLVLFKLFIGFKGYKCK